jgi:DNA-binding response OmpR family regulator
MIKELKRILLVEDDPRDVELTMEALGENNLMNVVDVVGDGEKALDYLFKRGKFAARSGNSPAVILLDLKLPKVDGKEVLKAIRADEKTRMIPVVVLTSSREERDLVESYRLGVNAYVVKPVDFHEFVDAVKNLGLFWAVINEPPPGTEKKTT